MTDVLYALLKNTWYKMSLQLHKYVKIPFECRNAGYCPPVHSWFVSTLSLEINVQEKHI